MNPLDRLDARLLLALDESPDATVSALATTLGVARNTVHARLTRLRSSDVLLQMSRRVDPKALGFSLVAFVSLSISQSTDRQVTQALQQIPAVVEIHSITGDADIWIKVLARSTGDLRQVTSRILQIDGVTRTNTTLSLAEDLSFNLHRLLEQLAAS